MVYTGVLGNDYKFADKIVKNIAVESYWLARPIL